MAEIEIKLPGAVSVPGSAPLVLVGPNGVGKSRLGGALVGQFQYQRIPALRNLMVAESIGLQRLSDAKQQTDNQIRESGTQTWQQASELNSILAELKAEDSQLAVDFRDAWDKEPKTAKPTDSRLKKLVRLWGLVFPGRTLDLSTYNPKISNTLSGRPTAPYGANQMSDGERAAFYLISRILRASPGVIIVDEPEVHFHPLLARTFWDTMEEERSDCRFIYITHDIPFALSRRGGRIGIVRSESKVDLVPENAPIPVDLFEAVLGAASVSMVAKRVVFCEGLNGRSIDSHFYGAWFQAPMTLVVPVGSCDEVKRARSALMSSSLIANMEVCGIVDRDYWPEDELQKIQASGVHVLPTHEVEGLLCNQVIAQEIAKRVAHSDFEAAYRDFEAEVRTRFSGVRFNKQVLERSKCEAELRLRGITNPASPTDDNATTRANFLAAINPNRAVPDFGALFDNHERTLTAALAGPAKSFLEYFPGKDCLEVLCRHLGVTRELYVGMVIAALKPELPDDSDDQKRLRAAIVMELAPKLPPRTI